MTRSTPARLYQDRSNITISPGVRQMVHIPLEIPLCAFLFGGLLQRDDAGSARVEVLREPFDGAALAGRVAALEHDHMPVIVGLAPLLQLEQLDLQQSLLFLVPVAMHAFVVRVVLPPGVDRDTVGTEQNRIVVVIVADLKSRHIQAHGRKVPTRRKPGATAR